MDFEYFVSDDYCKIVKEIDEYDLPEECIEKLKELDIKRVGEILACSEIVIGTYKENAKWIREARDYFVSKEGELGIWRVIEYAQFPGKSGNNKYEMYQCIVEDEPLEIMEHIIVGTLRGCLSEYTMKTGRELTPVELELSDELCGKLGGENILSHLLVLPVKKLCEHTKFTLSTGEIEEIRKKTAELITLPEGIFEFLDEVDAKQERCFEEDLRVD